MYMYSCKWRGFEYCIVGDIMDITGPVVQESALLTEGMFAVAIGPVPVKFDYFLLLFLVLLLSYHHY